MLIYVLFNFFFLDHGFYFLSYFFFFLFWLGSILLYNELDLFTAFLWVIELSIIIIFFLFFLFISNMFHGSKFSIYSRFLLVGLLLFPAFILIFFFSGIDFFNTEFFNIYFITNWIDFYSYLFSDLSTEVWLLSFFFVTVNFFELLFIGNLISLGCVVVVILFLLIKELKIFSDINSINNISAFSKNYKFLFFRHQCFYKQDWGFSKVRICKKKF